MKKAIVLGILLTIGFLAMGQPAPCPCDEGECKAQATAILLDRSFTIPLGTITSALVALLCPKCTVAVEVAAGFIVPDIKVTLDTDLSGELGVSNCPIPCCEPGRKLYGSVDVLLEGVTKPFGIPPTSVSFSKFVSATVVDNEEGDRATAPCEIIAHYEIPRSGVSLDLVFLGNVLVNIGGSGEVGAEITGLDPYASCACGGKPNQPPNLNVPPELVVPLGVETPIPVPAEDPDGDPVWIYLSSTDRHPLAGVEITFDPENRQWSVYAEGEWLVGATAAVVFYAYDLKPGEVVEGEEPAPGQYYREVSKSLTLKFVANHPPQAFDDTITVSHGELECHASPKFRGFDPDLPDNFGFHLYFSPTWEGDKWDCDLSLMGLGPGFAGHCSGNECWASMPCDYIRCSMPAYPIPPGTYEFPFIVFEFKPGGVPTDPRAYGLNDTGVWRLVANNKPPEVTTSPSEVKVKPGDAVSAVVTATDDDEDMITLTKISGPGSFSTVTGMSSVSGEYTWTATGYTSWQLVGFRADDGWGGSDLAYLLIHIIQPPRAYDGYITVPRGGTATASLYLSDPDTPPEGLKVTLTPPPGIETGEVAIEEPPPCYGSYYGYTARVEVSVDQTVPPGSHQVDFTVTDPDGGSDSATLYVDVYVDPELNSSPEFASDELSGELGIHVPGGSVV